MSGCPDTQIVPDKSTSLLSVFMFSIFQVLTCLLLADTQKQFHLQLRLQPEIGAWFPMRHSSLVLISNSVFCILIHLFQDRTLRLNELNSLRKQIEQEFQRKMKLEEDIIETLRNKLTMDKASEYAKKTATKLRTRIAEAVSTFRKPVFPIMSTK